MAMAMQASAMTPAMGASQVRLCFEPMPFLDHPLAFRHSRDLLWALPAVSTPETEPRSGPTIFNEVHLDKRAHTLWKALTKHVNELMCFRLTRTETSHLKCSRVC